MSVPVRNPERSRTSYCARDLLRRERWIGLDSKSRRRNYLEKETLSCKLLAAKSKTETKRNSFPVKLKPTSFLQ